MPQPDAARDPAPPRTPVAGARSPVAYSERLSVPWWWYVVALVATSVLAYEVHLGTPWIPVWLPLLATVPLTVWGLHSLGGLRVSVVAAELRVGEAHLPLTVVARAAAVPPTARRTALGRRLDPAAFVQLRAWVPAMVAVVLDDPDDPTPYWLISTRRPDALIGAIEAGSTSPH